MQRVRLQDLAVVHQPAYLFSRRREPCRADHLVECLGRRQMMAHRTNAAQALDHHRHFPVGAALDEALEAAELDDVQAHLLHLIALVEQDGHLAVALDARHGVDGDAAQACRMLGGFELAAHAVLFQSYWIRPWPSSGARPARTSLSDFQMASAEGGQPGMK